MLWIIFALLTLALSIYIITRFAKPKLTAERFVYTDPETVAVLYNLLYTIDQVLTNHNIGYFIEGGTLLGALRHGGIIPWDDDADIDIFDTEEQALLNLVDIFRQHGLGVHSYSLGYKIFPLNGKGIDGEIFKFPFVDVFIVRDNGETIEYANSKAKSMFKGWSLNSKAARPLQRYKFGATRLLKSYYGEDCFTHAYMQTSHELGLDYVRTKHELTEFERQPARPIPSV